MRKGIISLVLIFAFSLNTTANVDRWDAHKENWSPLMLAAYSGKTNEIIKLIKKDPNVDRRSKDGFTALEIAIRAQKFVSVKVLLENRAETNLGDKDGMSPLMLACLFMDLKIVQILIDNGAKVDAENNSGWTSLMSATSWGTIETIKLLNEYKVDINHQRHVDGWTALMLAVYNGEPKKVKILLEYGSAKNIKNSNGETAEDINYDVNMKWKKDKKTYGMIKELLSQPPSVTI